jgi:hypothetical protein
LFAIKDDILILRSYRENQKERKITLNTSGSRHWRRTDAVDGAPLQKLPNLGSPEPTTRRWEVVEHRLREAYIRALESE